MKNPLPPNDWFHATLRAPIGHVQTGTKVAVRQSREGGWRIMWRDGQLAVSDKGIWKMVKLTLGADAMALKVADQSAATANLAAIFKATPPVAKTAPASTGTSVAA